jgi:hypothetical protein
MLTKKGFLKTQYLSCLNLQQLKLPTCVPKKNVVLTIVILFGGQERGKAKALGGLK